MTVLVPIMLFGWIPISVTAFLVLPPRKAVAVSVIGGVLLLPMTGYDLLYLPRYDKITAIALGVIAGSALTASRYQSRVEWGYHDIPMIAWCFLCPLATSLSNRLGVYDGLSTLLTRSLYWGAFYWAGRKFFGDRSSLRELSLWIVMGGLVYVPLALFEIRMSPQLSMIVYGFFPHQWLQHMRYGGYRPIVFMQHGLMVSLWMAICSTIALWLWLKHEVGKIFGVPIPVVVITLVSVTVLCKSANGWFFLCAGFVAYLLFHRSRSLWLLRLAILLIPAYIILRATNTVSLEYIEFLASHVFDDERVHSLFLRLLEENAFSQKALQRPLFGWGGWGRGWPIDQLTDQRIVRAVDSQWLIVFSQHGIAGLFSFYGAMLVGPWYALRQHGARLKHNGVRKDGTSSFYSVLLSVVVIFFVVDSLVNGMPNPVYVLCTGALVSNYRTTTRMQAL